MVRIVLCMFFWLLGGAGCASFGLPVATKPLPPDTMSYVDAGAVVLDDVATLDYRVMTPPDGGDKRLVAVLDHRRRIQVLRESGLKEAEISLPVDATTTVTRVVARSIAVDGSISNMAVGTARIKARKRIEERAGHTGDLIFVVPKAQVGGVIEYRIERIYTEPMLVPPWVFGGRLPVQHAEFGLVTAPEVRVDIRHGYGDKSVDRAPIRRDVVNGASRLVFIVNDVPPFFKEVNDPDVSHRAPWLATSLRVMRQGNQSERYESWDDVARYTLDLMAEVEAKPVVGTLRQRLSKTRDILQPLMGYGLGVHNPVSAERLRDKAPACSRDAAALALGATKNAAQVVLLTGPQSPPFGEDFVGAYIFSHVALAVRAEQSILAGRSCDGPAYRQDPLCNVTLGDWVFVDPSCQSCSLGTLPQGFAGSRALMFGTDGKSSWVDVPMPRPVGHALWSQARLNVEVDGKMTGILTAEAYGHAANQWRQALSDASQAIHEDDASSSDAEASFVVMLGEHQKPMLTGIVLKDAHLVDKPIAASAQLHRQLTKEGYTKITLAPLDLVGSSLPAWWRGSRLSAALIDGPKWREATAEITLPPSYKANIPPPIKLAHPVAEYAAGFSQRGRTLRYARRLVIKDNIVAKDAWPEFRSFFEAIRAAEAEPLVLEDSH